MAAGGLDAGFFIVFVGQTARTDEGYAQAQADALTKFDAIHRMAEQLYPERIEIAYRAADVPRIAASGKLVAAIGVENGFSLGRDLGLLERYYDARRALRRARPRRRQRPRALGAPAPAARRCRGARYRRQRARRRGDRAHEPAWANGRRLARLEADGARRDAPVRCAGHRVALLRRERQRTSAQHGRRDAARSQGRRRCRANRRVRRVLAEPAGRESGGAAGATRERGPDGGLAALAATGAPCRLRRRSTRNRGALAGGDRRGSRRSHRLRRQAHRHRPCRHRLGLRRRRRRHGLGRRERNGQRHGRARKRAATAARTSPRSGAAICCASGARPSARPRSLPLRSAERIAYFAAGTRQMLVWRSASATFAVRFSFVGWVA